MPNPSSITDVDAIIMIGVYNVFPQPVRLQQFAADDIFDVETIPAGEFVMGVDGYLTGGFVNAPVPMTIALQADSPSNALFDEWYQYQRTQKILCWAWGSVVFPALGTKWILDKGGLRNYPIVPNAKRVLQPRRFTIVWQSPAATPTAGAVI